MDHFYAFILFVVLLALDLLARQNWLGLYYRWGIPVFFTRRKILPENAPTAGFDAGLEAKEITRTLGERFKPGAGVPLVLFKALSAGRANPLEIAFHEKLFDARSGSRFLPVTHSLARLHLEKGVVTVAGYVDWYVLFVLVYLVITTLADRTFIFVDVVVLLVFGLSYLAQAAISRLVAERVQEILAKG